MDTLYGQLSFLPETLQSIIVATILIIVGYMISKIFAGMVGGMHSKILRGFVSLTRSNPHAKETAEKANAGVSNKWSRLGFWILWLCYIFIGTNEIYPISSAIFQYILNPTSSMSMLLFIGACILIAGENHIDRFFKFLQGLFRSIPLPKNNSVFRIIIWFSWFPIFVVCVSALALPETLGHNVVFTFVILFFGWLLSKALENTISSILNLFGWQNDLITKFISYLVFVHFLIIVVKIWTSF